MSFLSFSFALFLLCLVPAYWLSPSPWRRPLLLLSSLGFYAAAYPPHALLIVTLTLVVFALGEGVTGPQRQRGLLSPKGLFVVGVVLCVGVLGYFKYARLFLQTVHDLGGPAWAAPELRVPLGISFFTFEFVHYLTDMRLGRIQKEGGRATRLLHFSLFTLFFPTLLSGPIKRYQVFVKEGAAHQTFRQEFLAQGLSRMLIGLCKKVILADSMTSFSVRLLTPDQVTPQGLWVAMYAYAFKIYFDFSGYSDLAIGASRLFGYRVPENFDSPYLQKDLSAFWRCWHMSLSSWIRDYLFIPLGGSRVSPLRAAVNLTGVMALCGLWHGASWNFVLWGLWHGLGLAGLRLWRKLRTDLLGTGRAAGPAPAPAQTTAGRILSVLLTFHFVCLGWVLFATPSLQVAWLALRRMFFLAP